MTSRSVISGRDGNQRASILLGNTRSETVQILERRTTEEQNSVAELTSVVATVGASICILAAFALLATELRGLLDFQIRLGVEDAMRVLAGR